MPIETITVTTRREEEVVDITDAVERALRAWRAEEGVCIAFAAHTTCALTTADLDPGTDLDLLQAVRSMLPQQRYRHPHNPEHAPDHILSSVIGASVAVPYRGGRPLLGTWQRIILVELDGPRQRTVHLATM